MPTIYSYQKVTGNYTTLYIKMPESQEGFHSSIGTELCTIDGLTYVSLPDGVSLPEDQHPEVVATIQEVTLTPELREAIKLVSPHALLIAQRVIDKIRAVYPLEEELFFARIAVGALQGSYTLQAGEAEELAAYQVCVEEARDWGRAERAKLGLYVA